MHHHIMLFTKELATHVLVTVLLVGPIGLCHSQEDRISINQQHWARTAENKRNEDKSLSSRLRLTSEEEPGILLPPEDQYNFVGQDDPTTTQSAWRRGRNQPFPATTVVSTNSYSIRPGNSAVSGSQSHSDSSFVFNAKPVSIITTGNGYTVKSTSPSSYYPDGTKYTSYSNKKNDKDKTTIYVKNSCFGPRCPGSSDTKPQTNDDWKSYHYILNKDAKQKLKRFHNQDGPVRRNDENIALNTDHEMTLSIPFIVEPAVSANDRSYTYEYEPYGISHKNRNNRRVSRTTTTTTTPGWVKLKPVMPENGQYDPFTLNGTRRHSNPGHQQPDQNTQFSNRLGVELNPDTFAERWGWGDPPLKNEKASGSRLPSWLQEIHSGLNRVPTRDSDKNWVKLEPIPVSGVTISKWVPKNTHSSELPTTNWPTRDNTRDRPYSNDGGNHPQGNTKWWDIIDSINRLHRPSYLPSSPVKVDSHSHHGWGPNKGSSSSWERDRDRTPTNHWNEIIYPEGPSSATVSWQQDKDLSKYPSSFPMSSSWPDNPNIRRPSTSATGSWSADRGNTQFSNSAYGSGSGGNRRHGSSSYPDRSVSEDDPRWVLVSNSRKVTVNPPEPQLISSHGYNNDRYHHSPIDKYADFPFYEPPYNHRVGKNYKLVAQAQTHSEQDEAFYKVNATLSNLTPVLTQRGVSTDINSIRSSLTTKSPKKAAFIKPYSGDGRKVNDRNETYIGLSLSSPQSGPKPRKGLSINPVYAAVGAGMIPASMAAILPMVLGRRRRDLGHHFNDNPYASNSNKVFNQRLVNNPLELLESFDKSQFLKPPIKKYFPVVESYTRNNRITTTLKK